MAFPDERDRTLMKQALRVVGLAGGLADWLSDHGTARLEKGLGEISGDQESALLRLRQEARNLHHASRVPVAAAVYGPSQVGKSLFVGRVLRPSDDRHSPLGRDEALGPPGYFQHLDFITDLNPQIGEREATALVTRFTTKDRLDPTVPSAFPVVVKALTRAEWLRILARGFKAECSRRDEGLVWGESALADLFERARKDFGGPKGDPEWRTDLYEVYAYMHRHYPRDFAADTIQFNGFLSTYRLSPKGYEAVASPLFWDEWPDLNALFLDIAELIRTIHATGKPGLLCHWAGVKFLLDSQLARTHDSPTSRCFPHVDWADFTLELDRGSGWWTLDYRPGSGTANVDAHRIQAAMLELVIPVLPDRLDESWRKVVREIDLLDIPGMRAEKVVAGGKRTSAERIEERMEIVKRGKVLYLFEHYIEELQVQTLLLLTRYGNVDVKDQIKYYVNLWGNARYGKAWPRGAGGDPPALFMGMTGIDAEFRNHRGVPDEEFRKYYDSRVDTLRDILGAAVMDDFGGRRFTNIYPLRYPGSWDTTADERRARGEEKTWDRAAVGFLGADQIRAHVKSPDERWRAAMDDRDGGVNLVAAGFLACTGVAGKQDRLRLGIEQTEDRLLQMARGWAVDEDANVDRDRRLIAARRVLDWLGEDEHLIYYRALALKETLCVKEADIWDLADAASGPGESAQHMIVPLERRFPPRLREFLRGWSSVTMPGRWQQFTASHEAGGPWLEPEAFGALAQFLVDYLCSEPTLERLVERLMPVVRLSLNDEAAARHARRKYVQLILNDFLMNPGPSSAPMPAGDEADTGEPKRDYGLMQPFFDRWSQRLPGCLASAAGTEVLVPPGNAELHEMLRHHDAPSLAASG